MNDRLPDIAPGRQVRRKSVKGTASRRLNEILGEKQAENIRLLASALGKDEEAVVSMIVARWLDGEGAHLLQEAQGIAELDAGQGVAFDEVMDKAAQIVRLRERAGRGDPGASAPDLPPGPGDEMPEEDGEITPKR